MEEKSYGQIAFEAYNESKGGVTYDGKPIPPWSEVGDAVRAGWEAAANAATDALLIRLDHEPWKLIDRSRRAVDVFIPRGREQALTLTKLDEASMWFGRIPLSIGG